MAEDLANQATLLGLAPGSASIPIDRKDEPFHFRLLPQELRLRILTNTHLGTPEDAGYDAQFERLLIRDGKLVPGLYDWATEESTICPFAHRHADAAPPCRCRILPTALFLVDRQMYDEAAVEVFYPNAVFEFWQDDLGSTLSFLRDVVPREALARWRRVSFTMTDTQCEGWTGGRALEGGYPPGLLRRITKICWPNGGPRPEFDYKADWRAVLRFLATNADVPRLHICVNMGMCSWSFVEDTLIIDEASYEWYRFIYDFCTDVATAMCCELKGLGGVSFQMNAFSELAPWLEREVLGRDVEPREPPRRAPDFYQVVPYWHDLDQRLEGSNYNPEREIA